VPDPLALAVAATAVFAGAVLQGAVGFGLALVATPVLLIVDTRLVPGPIILAALVLTVLTAWRDWQAIDFQGLKWGLIGRAPGTLAGAGLLAILPADRLEVSLGALVLLAVAISVSGVRLDPSPRTLLGAGLLSGFMGTASSIGGPPIALVYQHAPGSRLRGTLGVYFVVGGAMSLAAIAAVGRFGAYELKSGLALIPAVVLGFAISNRITPWVDRGYTRPAVLAVAAAGGLVVLVRQLV